MFPGEKAQSPALRESEAKGQSTKMWKKERPAPWRAFIPGLSTIPWKLRGGAGSGEGGAGGTHGKASEGLTVTTGLRPQLS